MAELGSDELRALLGRIAGSVRSTGLSPGVDAEIDWRGLTVYASVRGTNVGSWVAVLGVEMGPYLEIVDRLPMVKLLEHSASNASVRMVVVRNHIALESAIISDEIEYSRREEIVRGRLSELYAVAAAWLARLGLPTVAERSADRSLAMLKQQIALSAEHALVVAALGFGVAGADGVISTAEREKLRAWLREIPSFAALDLSRVVHAIANLAMDPARVLLESARHLEPTARLFAWGLANEMAYADGFASEEERQYLANVAMVFKLSPEAIAPLAAEAQERAVHRETTPPPPPRAD